MSSTGRRKKDTLTWWQDRIKILKGLQNEAAARYAENSVAYEVGPQAISKLALLGYFVKVYSDIIKSNFPKANYVDLFAGSGLTRVDSTGDIVMGSAMLANHVPRDTRKFDRLVLFENDPASAAALRQRVPNAEVVEKDVNSISLTDLLGKDDAWKVPTLGFVDPEGMAVDWATVEQLLSRWSDVIINYQVEAVRRVAGGAYGTGYAKKMTRFFGTDEWTQLGQSDEAYLDLYLRQIRKYKDLVIETRVRGKGGYFYYMIAAVKKTRGGSTWIDSIYRAKDYIEKAGPDLIEQLLDIYRGGQSTLG